MTNRKDIVNFKVERWNSEQMSERSWRADTLFIFITLSPLSRPAKPVESTDRHARVNVDFLKRVGIT